MKTFELKGTLRTDLGKKASKAMRRAGSVPCEFYGNGENIHFSCTQDALRKLIYTPEIYLVNLNIDGREEKAIIKELQFHPVSDKVIHIDFLAVTEDKPIVMDVPVRLEGLAVGVRAGGKLSLEMRKLRVKGHYSNVPEALIINVENLDLGKTIQVKALQFENLEVLNAPNSVVCAVKLTRAARGAAAAAAAK